MNSNDVKQIAADWIAWQEKRKPQPSHLHDDDPAFAVVLKLDELIWDDWNMALTIAVEIADRTDDPHLTAILGASTLEKMLERHGYEVLPGFLKAAKANPVFRQALRNVWECSDPYVWEQFLRVRDKLDAPIVPEHITTKRKLT